MHINQLKESRFLKKEDVGEGMEVMIRALKQENVAMESQEPEMKWVLYFEHVEKGMVLNPTNGQLIAKILGSEETDHWAGKTIELFNDPSVAFAGKLTGGIRVRKPSAKSGVPF